MNILRNYFQGDISEITARVEECCIDLHAVGFDIIPNSDNRWWVKDALAFLPECTTEEAERELLSALQALTNVPEGRKVLRITLSDDCSLQLSPEFLATVSEAAVYLEFGY